MPFLAGQIVTAGQLNRIQPKKFGAVGSGSVVGPQTNADVPSATVTIVAETAATYVAWCVWDSNVTSGTTGTWLGRLALDGVNQSPLGTMNHPTLNGRGQPVQQYTGTLSAAGEHTFKLVTSPMSGQTTQGVNCSIVVEITEVV